MASIFSGSAGRKASQAANKQIGEGLGIASGQITDAKNSAAGYLNQNPNIYQDAYGKAQGLLDSAYGDAKSQAQGTPDVYNPFYNTGVQANTAYSNAMGLNGAEGYNSAMQNFRTGPGYQFQMDQGLDAINRTAAARGGLASGNNTVDLLKYAQGTADQSWNNYLSGLNNQIGTGMQAASGIANAKQGLASLAMNYGNQGAQLAQGLGDRLAGVNTSLAGNEMNTGNNLAGLTTNAFNAMSENTKQGMMAGQQAAANRFGLAMGLANTALGGLGKLFGGGLG